MSKSPALGPPPGTNLRLPGLMKICWFVASVQLVAGLAAIALGAAVILECKARSAHALVVESRLRSWQTKHQLSDWQLERLRQLEFEFHGKGGLFAAAPPTPEERAEHRRRIALDFRFDAGAEADRSDCTAAR